MSLVIAEVGDKPKLDRVFWRGYYKLLQLSLAL